MDEAQINKAVRDLEDTEECEHGNESNFEDCEEEISEIYKLAQKNIGSSFIITALQAYLNTDGGNDVVTGGRFVCSPRQRDANPGTVPIMHPLRAIAKVLCLDHGDDAVIRMYVYAIDDPYALDILLHSAKSTKVKIIIEPSLRNVHAIQEFCKSFSLAPDGTRPRTLFQNLFEFRAFQKNAAHCHSFSSMHEKKIVTPQYTVVGSYNLTYQARVYNRESIYILDTTNQDVEAFDNEWNALADQRLNPFDPDLNLFKTVPIPENKKRKRKTITLGDGTSVEF